MFTFFTSGYASAGTDALIFVMRSLSKKRSRPIAFPWIWPTEQEAWIQGAVSSPIVVGGPFGVRLKCWDFAISKACSLEIPKVKPSMAIRLCCQTGKPKRSSRVSSTVFSWSALAWPKPGATKALIIVSSAKVDTSLFCNLRSKKPHSTTWADFGTVSAGKKMAAVHTSGSPCRLSFPGTNRSRS